MDIVAMATSLEPKTLSKLAVQTQTQTQLSMTAPLWKKPQHRVKTPRDIEKYKRKLASTAVTLHKLLNFHAASHQFINNLDIFKTSS